MLSCVPPVYADCLLALMPFARRIRAMNLKNTLGNIQADDGNLHGGRFLQPVFQQLRAWHSDAAQEPSTTSFLKKRTKKLWGWPR
jgi:hypothetical protein